ncbi:MAG: transposase [Gammaproteobacteria bacterium]|nr:MAG: transposase [Gammaproteobacteria bacterium]RLA32969.1 MAG: transposase [Gammaproteobacteria bacterium]
MVGHNRHSKNLRKHRYSASGHIYLVTTTCIARNPIFENTMLGGIVVNEIRQSDEARRTYTFAYVVMPDHLHWLFQLQQSASLSSIVQRVKGRSANQINKLRNLSGPVWQPGYHDRTLRIDESLERIGNYIVANPVRGGIVKSIEDYPLWDLMWRRRWAEIRG